MENVMPTYGRIDLSFERGEGPWLFTESGEKFFLKKWIAPSFNLPLLGKPIVIKFFISLNYLN